MDRFVFSHDRKSANGSFQCFPSALNWLQLSQLYKRPDAWIPLPCPNHGTSSSSGMRTGGIVLWGQYRLLTAAPCWRYRYSQRMGKISDLFAIHLSRKLKEYQLYNDRHSAGKFNGSTSRAICFLTLPKAISIVKWEFTVSTSNAKATFKLIPPEFNRVKIAQLPGGTELSVVNSCSMTQNYFYTDLYHTFFFLYRGALGMVTSE